MTKIATLKYGMTLNTGNFNNFKPEVELSVDLEGDVDEQIAAGVEAIRKMQGALSEELERILESEGIQGYESLLIRNSEGINNLTSRMKIVEKILVEG